MIPGAAPAAVAYYGPAAIGQLVELVEGQPDTQTFNVASEILVVLAQRIRLQAQRVDVSREALMTLMVLASSPAG